MFVSTSLLLAATVSASALAIQHAPMQLVKPSAAAVSTAPSKSFSLTYAHGSGVAHPMKAVFKVTSKKDTIVLDHFGTVSCHKVNKDTEAVTVTFKNAQVASKTFEDWKKHQQDLAVVIGHGSGCFNSHDTQSLKANHLSLKGASIIIEAEQISHEVTFADYELFVNRAPIAKRDTTEDKISSYDWNMNYNATTGHINNRNISMISGIECINCYSTGSTKYELYVKAKWSMIESYKISHIGNHKTNMDIEIDFPVAPDSTLLSFNLATIPLAAPIVVPGILSFGPSFTLTASLTYAVEHAFNMKFGFDNSKVYDFEITSNKGLFSLPTIIHKGTSSSNEHKLITTCDKTVDVGVHAIPAAHYGLSLFTVQVLDLSVGIDASMGVKIHTGTEVICQGDALDYTLYEELSLYASYSAAFFFNKKITIIDSGKQDRDCSFCYTPAKCAARSAHGGKKHLPTIFAL